MMNAKLREVPTILHMSTVHPRGDTRIFHRQCRTLAEKTSANVILLVADGYGSESLYGVEVRDIGRAPLGRIGRLVFSSARAWAVALKLRPQVVHFHDPELMFVALWLKISGIPAIFDMHENVVHQVMNKSWIPKLLRGIIASGYRVIERIVMNNFIVVFAERSYEKDYPWLLQTETILNLPRREMCNFQCLEKDENAIAYIGGVTPERGGFTMIEAIVQVRAQRHPVNFECIGPVSREISESPHFKQGVTEGWLVAPGRLSGPEGWERVAKCQIGLAVLQAKKNYTESYPTKMFEYMALGLAVIVSDFPLYREIVAGHRCGLLVDPYDAKALAEAIVWLLEHPREASNMGNRGREAILDQLNWSAEADKLCALYNAVIPEITIGESAETQG